MGVCRVTEMRHKEVINSESGCRLGFVDDVEVDTVTAKLVAVIIYGRPKCFGLFGRYEDIVIRWEHIRLIGEDTILVSHCPTQRKPRKAGIKIPFLNSR